MPLDLYVKINCRILTDSQRLGKYWQNLTAAGAKKKVEYALQVPAAGLIDEADKNRFDLEFVAQASKDGVPASDKGQSVQGTLHADALAKIRHDGIFYENDLELRCRG